MSEQNNKKWDGTERRKPNSCRRSGERRTNRERRFDSRENGRKPNRSFSGWLRSLTNARLGVDRRKNVDQRVNPNRRRPKDPSCILTEEELETLLK